MTTEIMATELILQCILLAQLCTFQFSKFKIQLHSNFSIINYTKLVLKQQIIIITMSVTCNPLKV